MLIRDADSARAWLRAWSGKPRRGILLAVLDGLRMAAGLAQPQEAKRIGEAVRVLEKNEGAIRP